MYTPDACSGADIDTRLSVNFLIAKITYLPVAIRSDFSVRLHVAATLRSRTCMYMYGSQYTSTRKLVLNRYNDILEWENKQSHDNQRNYLAQRCPRFRSLGWSNLRI